MIKELNPTTMKEKIFANLRIPKECSIFASVILLRYDCNI